jgi:hypothetical protein
MAAQNSTTTTPAESPKKLGSKKCIHCVHLAWQHDYDGYGADKKGSWDWYRCTAEGCDCRVKLDIPSQGYSG